MMKKLDTPRPLTFREKQLLLGVLLDGAAGRIKSSQKLKENPSKFISQIENLQVKTYCDCGHSDCETVGFIDLEYYNTEVIAHGHLPDGRWIFVHVLEDTDQIVELEIV
ncbi:hypothetical protein E308F_29790 [Moorella sp. E308F]|uniref:hypothetical protein n=1 Tax=Moorella sp. E308F TaxID=2572682 RepID=UPI0010FFC457|nr:hypothetical protein [Moorella sp. E308F]GEA16733.1 hypothetical protein E308F_29790 [Moorella sp. E308F]